MMNQLEIAILVPCYNEAATIEQVIHAFKNVLPDCVVYVYDNNSTDNTYEIAQKAGAVVRKEPRKGKGNVMRRMFADIDADIFVLVDGDHTYDAESAPDLIHVLLDQHLDMVVGARQECLEIEGKSAYRPGHRFGNKMFTWLIAKLFGKQFTDVFSGYRVFTRRFIKSFPAESKGFDIETELTIHTLELNIPSAEIPTKYVNRPEGSFSKLNKYRDGIRILWCVVTLMRETRPLLFYGGIFIFFSTLSVLIFLPVLLSFLQTGKVERFPTAILSTGIMLLGFLSLVCGLILDNVCKSRKAMKRFFYLTLPKLERND